MIDGLPIIAFGIDSDGFLRDVSRGWTQWSGFTAEQSVGCAARTFIDFGDDAAAAGRWDAVLAGDAASTVEVLLRRNDAPARWTLAQIAPAGNPANGETRICVATFIDIDERWRQNARDRRERKRVEDGLRLLSRTGAAVVDSLDYGRTLQNIARAFVDGFAAYCLIDVMPPDGRWERTVEHRDPSFVPLLVALSRPTGNHPIARAIETGEGSVMHIDDDWARNLDTADATDADRLAAIRRLRVRSIITVPVVTPSGAVVGALTCALDDVTVRDDYGADDLGFVLEVGRRAGAAIANMQLYERERRIALEFQNASLPPRLPALRGVVLDAEYRPGSSEAKIGGDWYDAFVLGDGRLMITVGDVLGHGLQAAVTMTKLRLAMQSAARVDADPNLMLRVADATLRHADPNAYATALAAVYDAAAHSVTFASAGHPGPLHRTSSGDVEEISRSGSMIGLREGDEAATTTIATPPGSTLVFFTDGLVEVVRDMDEGYRRLSDALRSDAIMRAKRPAQAIVNAVLGSDAPYDDIAVLVLSFVA